MKFALILLVFLAGFTVSATPIERNKVTAFQYPRFVKFPDGGGNLQDVDLEATPDMKFIEDYERDPNNNQYILYTRRNQVGQNLFFNDVNSITGSNFNSNVPTVVITHGWRSTRNTEPNPTIRNAYLTKSDVNVIVMDWSYMALAEYVTAVEGVPAVGEGLGQFLTFLNQVSGAPFNSMHLIGYSLGAHVIGHAGRALSGQAARVTGLDPAGFLWSSNLNRLRASDGIYVEAIHTDGDFTNGGLGIGFAIVEADFFPNGGKTQPGCTTSMCNHNRAWETFAASVTYNHLIGQRCASDLEITLNTCRGNSLHMGNDILNKTGSGMYRLDTRSEYPY